MLYTLAVILLVLWLLGFVVFHLGAFVHILIVAAVVVFLFNLFTGRGARL